MSTSEFLPIITPIPDDNSAEAILYGSAYRFAKSSRYFWDQVEDEMLAEIERLKHQLIDREFCAHVMSTCPNMVTSRRPPVSHPDKIKDLWTLRRIVYLGSGLVKLDLMRRQNEMWSVMRGATEYTAGMMQRGEVTEAVWKAATAGCETNLDYQYVKEVLEREDLRAARETETILDDMDTFRRKCEAFERDFEDARRIRHREIEEEEEEEPFPDLRIFREVEQPDEIKDIFDDSTPEDDDWEGSDVGTVEGTVEHAGVSPYMPRLFDLTIVIVDEWNGWADPVTRLARGIRS